MDKLRPIEEVVRDFFDTTDHRLGEILKADREAVVKACAGVADAWVHSANTKSCDLYAAILAVAKPPEDPRERLGRVACEANNGCYWRDTPDKLREAWCIRAAAVLEEQRKIEEDGDGKRHEDRGDPSNG